MKRIAWLCLIAFSSLVVPQETVDWSSLVSKVSPAVVTIVSADVMDIAQGSGFLISSDGKIVTNFHVVEGKKNILARLSDGSFLAITGVLATDEANDLVILKSEGRNLPFVSLGDSDAVEVGEAICVIGSPMLLEGTVKTGIVSAVRELKDGRKLLQISVPVSKGSSGSPVFNRKGEVIGIASFRLAEGQNLNFAVPVNALKRLIEGMQRGLPLRQPSTLQEPMPQKPQPPMLSKQPSLPFPERILAELDETFNQAFQEAQTILDDYERLWTLRKIAEAMARAGQKERAVTLFDQSLQVAKNISDASKRSSALRCIAEAMAEAGLFNQSLQVAKNISDDHERSWALRRIAEAMAKVGLFDQSLQVAKNFLDDSDRLLALCSITEAMAEAGVKEPALWSQSIQVAQTILDDYERLWTLRKIAEAMAEAGLFNQSLQVAKNILDAYKRSLALRCIAEAMAEAGLLEQAFEVAKGIERPIFRLQALAAIMAEMRKAGMMKE